MSDDPEIPPEIAKMLEFFQHAANQSRADSIGSSRMALATHIFDILISRFLKSAKFDPRLVVLAVDYADELIAELKKPQEGS